MLVTLAK